MIRSLFYSPDKAIQTELKVAEFPHILKSKKGFLWVDFEATPPETDELFSTHSTLATLDRNDYVCHYHVYLRHFTLWYDLMDSA